MKKRAGGRLYDPFLYKALVSERVRLLRVMTRLDLSQVNRGILKQARLPRLSRDIGLLFELFFLDIRPRYPRRLSNIVQRLLLFQVSRSHVRRRKGLIESGFGAIGGGSVGEVP